MRSAKNPLNPRIALLFYALSRAWGKMPPRVERQICLFPTALWGSRPWWVQTKSDRQTKIAVWPPKPEVLFSGTIIDNVKSPTAILRFSTMTSSKKVPLNDCDNDQQPKIAIRPPKPEILISLEIYHIASKFQRQQYFISARHCRKPLCLHNLGLSPLSSSNSSLRYSSQRFKILYFSIIMAPSLSSIQWKAWPLFSRPVIFRTSSYIACGLDLASLSSSSITLPAVETFFSF